MKRVFSLILFLSSTLGFSLTRDEVLKISDYFNTNIQAIVNAIKNVDVSSDDGKAEKAILLTAYNRLTNDNKAREEAIKLLDLYLSKNKDPILLAYLGMNYSLIARDSMNPVVKINYSNKAIDIFNKAVEMAPNDWYVRFLRGNVFFNFPSFFNVGNKVKEDFFYLEDVIDKKGFFPGPSVLISVYYYLGEIYKGDGKISRSIEYWEKAVSVGDKYKVTNEEYMNAKKKLKLFSD